MMSGELNQPDEVAMRLRIMWFASVAEISDQDLQRRRWLDPENTNPHWSYIEFVCSYPNSCQLADAHARGWLTAREFDILSHLRQRILGYSAPESDDYNNAAVLADAAWLAVVACAQHARHELISTAINRDELAALSVKEHADRR